MPESTASPTAGPTVQCVGCSKQTTEPIEVRCWDPGSGPMRSQYACPGCTPRFLTSAEVWRLASAHAANCYLCRKSGPCDRVNMLMEVRRAARDLRRR